MTRFTLPDLGEGLQDAEIVNWHVTEGDHVTADQPLVSVETDKAVVEIPAPKSGLILKLLAQPGDIVPVGSALLDYSTELPEDAGAIVGDLQKEPTGPKSIGSEDADAVPAIKSGDRGRAKVAPAVRRLAETLGIDLHQVTPSGSNGVITSGDVHAAAGANAGTGRTEKLAGIRRAMAIRMAMAGRQVVPATLHDMADLGGWPELADILPKLVFALIKAIRTEPALNVSYDSRVQQRTVHDIVNVGIAVDTPGGLIVPVLKDAGSIPPSGLKERIGDLVQAVHNRTVGPEDLRGGTITLSNFGTLGGRHANLVVIPPQVAILGAGRIFGTPPYLPLSLTFDHRVVSGGEAARFLATFITDIQGSAKHEPDGSQSDG